MAPVFICFKYKKARIWHPFTGTVTDQIACRRNSAKHVRKQTRGARLSVSSSNTDACRFFNQHFDYFRICQNFKSHFFCLGNFFVIVRKCIPGNNRHIRLNIILIKRQNFNPGLFQPALGKRIFFNIRTKNIAALVIQNQCQGTHARAFDAYKEICGIHIHVKRPLFIINNHVKFTIMMRINKSQFV